MKRRISILIISLLFVIGFSVNSFAENEYNDIIPDYLWVGQVEPIYVMDISPYADIVSLESSNPDVIKIGGWKYAFTDHALYAKKPGNSIITLVYDTESGTDTMTKEVRVKKYPKPIKSLKVNVKKLNVSKPKFEYIKNGFKGTKVNVKVTPKKGWKIVDAYYFRYIESYDFESVSKGVKNKIKKGSDIKLAKKYSRILLRFTMENTEGEAAEYVIDIRR